MTSPQASSQSLLSVFFPRSPVTSDRPRQLQAIVFVTGLKMVHNINVVK
jgi:hypothetical protein